MAGLISGITFIVLLQSGEVFAVELNPVTTLFHIRPDFDAVETPDATRFGAFKGNNPHPTEKSVKQVFIGN